MPIYEYTCKDCGYHFDAIRSIKDADSQISCKKCQSQDTRRMISLFFSQSGGSVQSSGHSSTSCGCGGCSGGSCAGCHH
jgi:putative FmdB family regulatory protein